MNGPLVQPCAIDAQIGRRLRRRRCDLGMTPAQLACALQTSELGVLAYETGQSRISAATFFQLCKILRVRVAFFFEDMPANDMC